MTSLTAVADTITIVAEEQGSKVETRYVNAATFSVKPGSYLKLIFDRPVAFKVVQG